MIFNSSIEKIIFYNFPVILFSLIPIFLITGPFFTDLSVSLISVLFIIYCFKVKNFSYFKNKYFYFFLIFWIYLILNSIINNFNLDSLKISFFYFRYGIFVIAVTAFLETDDKFIKYFFYCIFICFTALIIDGFYEYFFDELKKNRVTSFFGDEKILGSYLSRLWPIFFGLSILIIKQKKKIFYLFISIFILSEVLVFLSAERSAFFYINLSAIFVLVFSQKLLKLRLTILLSSILLLSIISLINPTAKERVIDRTLKQMNLVDDKMNLIDKKTREKNRLYIFSKEHTEIYKAAYKIFLDNKVLGAGVKNFRNICNDERYNTHRDSCSNHPHNTYIQILSETGIIGFAFFLFVLFFYLSFILRHLILRIKGKYFFTDFEICILSGITIYLWPFAPTGNVFNNWLNIAMILNLPFLLWSRKLLKSHK